MENAGYFLAIGHRYEIQYLQVLVSNYMIQNRGEFASVPPPHHHYHLAPTLGPLFLLRARSLSPSLSFVAPQEEGKQALAAHLTPEQIEEFRRKSTHP